MVVQQQKRRHLTQAPNLLVARRGVLGLVAGGAVAVLGGCGLMRPSEELRYRLTVEVETPQGLKSGSSVIEVRGVKNPDWVTPEGRGTRASFKGEAAAVDLPGGRTLFALLKTEGGASEASEYPWLAFRDRLKDSPDWLESMRRLRGWRGEVRPMPATTRGMTNGGQDVPALPLLVTFGDIADPKSVAKVDPANLAASFGSGVRLKRITVEVTDDEMTTEIGQRLRWLAKHQGGSLVKIAIRDYPPAGTPLPFATGITELHFRQGIEQ